MLSSNAPSKKRKKLRSDFYVIALFAALPFSCILFVYLASIGATEIFLSDWFLWLVSIPTFFAYQLSAAAYFGRIIDLGREIKNKIINRKGEFTGTLFGIVLGIGFGVALAILTPVPFASTLFAFAGILFTLRQISIFGGLGNRLGKCLDPRSRPLSEKWIVSGAVLIGLILSIALFATCTASMVSVVGVTFFFSGGTLIPVAVAGIIFILTMSSGFASAADYTAKSVSFLNYLSYLFKRKNISNHPEKHPGSTINIVRGRPWEYGLAGAGVTLGLIIGIAIAITVIAPNPVLAGGVIGCIAGILIVLACISVFGSLLSRIGRAVDWSRQQPLLSPAERAGPGPEPRLTPSPDNGPLTPLLMAPTPTSTTPTDTPRASPQRPSKQNRFTFNDNNVNPFTYFQGRQNAETSDRSTLGGSRLRYVFGACKTP
jgi:hypothetical protein